MNASRAAMLLFVTLAIIQCLYFGPMLPDPVASHFNAAGQPDGWSSRSAFLLINVAFVPGMAALFLGITGLAGKMPNARINLPNKDYWLAPERRAETLAKLQQLMEWLGAATLALLVGMTQLTIEANLTGEAPGNTFWVLFGSYFLIVIVWTVWLLGWAYKRPPSPTL